MFGAATKCAARRRKENAANKPRLRKLVWVARREAPAFSRGNAALKNKGCATWRAIPLALARGQEKDDGPTRGLDKQYG